MKKRYCSKCGKEMIERKVDANISILRISVDVRYKKYNPNTGKRQYLDYFRCPKKRWYNSHDAYIYHPGGFIE